MLLVRIARVITRNVRSVAASYGALVLALSLLHVVLPQRAGLLAMTQVFAPYLFLPLLPALPLAVPRGARTLRLVLVLCAFTYCALHMPRLVSATPAASVGASQIKAMTWNVALGGDAAAVRSVLMSRPAGVVALEEVYWEWMEQDGELAQVYPYRFGLPPRDPVSGMALLSVYPIIEAQVPEMPPDLWRYPRLLQARLDLGGGRTLLVVAAHPSPPGRTHSCALPVCYDAGLRDTRLSAIRALVEPALQNGEPVLLVGDFNVTERELGYRDVSKGLLDSHRVAGFGAGNTWGPGDRLVGHWLPLLRIDYLFSGPNVVPLATSVDCTQRGSDHCILLGTFEVR